MPSIELSAQVVVRQLRRSAGSDHLAKYGATAGYRWSDRPMFERVLVANRGAVARRIVRACNALDCESIAVYSDIDAGLPHVEEASRA